MGDLQAKLEERVYSFSKHGKFNGSVLVASDGEVILSKGYGMANYEVDVPNSPKTIFRLASITKQFTALAIMQLYEKGLVKLDDPLNEYLPEYPHGEQVTIHHLLTHTSGIWNHTNAADFKNTTGRYHSVDDLIDTFWDVPFDFQPGEKFNYSNSGYVLLGKIIEILSGKTYEEYLQYNLLQPLGMHNTGYDHNECIFKNRAAGYLPTDSGLTNGEFLHMSIPYSAGALHSTVEDLYILDQALRTEQLLTNESLEKMVHPYADAPSIGEGDRYGYGWIVPTKDRSVVYHTGAIPGFAAIFIRFLNDNATVIVLSNFMIADPWSMAWSLGDDLFQNLTSK